MPHWNIPGPPKLKHVPQPQFEIEQNPVSLNDDIEKFLKEKGWIRSYSGDGDVPFFQHPDFNSGPQYFEWTEAVAMEMIRFMRIGISA